MADESREEPISSFGAEPDGTIPVVDEYDSKPPLSRPQLMLVQDFGSL